MMKTYLDEIILHKQAEVAQLLHALSSNLAHPLHAIHEQAFATKNYFANALRNQSLAIIAEIKRKSPSRGELSQIIDPAALALRYCQGGAAAISVLTDTAGFGGSLTDLTQVANALDQQFSHTPILRKDFIVHPIQLAEAVIAGAACVLLIARVLKDELDRYLAAATKLGLEALVEVHDEEDLQYALNSRATIIGVNHRNLSTFTIDLSISERLKALIPDHCITVAESGIHTAETAQLMKMRGFDAVLVGEALVTTSHPDKLIRAMRGA